MISLLCSETNWSSSKSLTNAPSSVRRAPASKKKSASPRNPATHTADTMAARRFSHSKSIKSALFNWARRRDRNPLSDKIIIFNNCVCFTASVWLWIAWSVGDDGCRVQHID
uniref:(northern house mosquito) hypothetical protein n=1 Tax=Culex pipiens TaxID=7175 RepID=A0A8D8FTH1_CULPI